MTIEDTIRKHAFKNAHEHGKAQAKFVVGKVLAEHPEARAKMKEVMILAERIVATVNSMPPAEIAEKLKKYHFEEKKEEKKGITLPNAEKGNVVTRFPPEPSGYPHIGHAKAAFLDYEAAKAYDGKFLLRFDDTNPEKENSQFADAIKEGLHWLGIKWDAETYVSDSMAKLYGYAEEMIRAGRLYVCTCKGEDVRHNRQQGKGCACRERPVAESMKLWKDMLGGTAAEGSMVVRYKGDMQALNTVMRDPSMLRIIVKSHYRQGMKYRVWPLYDFEAPIMDSLEGITHAMRSKEYELRDELYVAVLEAAGLRKPILVEFSRLQIKNAPISKRLITPLIESRKVSGWDDPRLPTLAALRRRGIMPHAIRNFVLSFGLAKTESEPGWDALMAENKKLIDPAAHRYYFVASPVKLVVKGAPERKEAVLRKHPSNEAAGTRRMTASGTFHIAKSDADSLKVGDVLRLKELYNVRIDKVEPALISATYHSDDPLPPKKIQWVGEKALTATVMVPGDLLDESGNYREDSLRTDEGFVEPDAALISEGEVVQFERYGFCRLDDRKSMRFVYTSP